MSIIEPKDSRRKPPDSVESFCCYPDCEDVPWYAARAPLCWAHMVDVAGQVMLEMNDRKPELHVEPPVSVARVATVYFLRFGDRVKIGFTTNLSRRLTEIPHDEVLATFPGTMADEKRCHAAFADLRLTGEWFQLDQRILDFIAERAA